MPAHADSGSPLASTRLARHLVRARPSLPPDTTVQRRTDLPRKLTMLTHQTPAATYPCRAPSIRKVSSIEEAAQRYGVDRRRTADHRCQARRADEPPYGAPGADRDRDRRGT